MSFFPDLIGAAAGLIITASALPKLGDRVKGMLSGTSRFSLADLCRDALQGFGNVLWVYVGLERNLHPMVFFCGLSATFLFGMVCLNLRSRERHNLAGK